MAKVKKEKVEKKEESSCKPFDQLGAYLHNTRSEHLNFLPTILYKVSTGSLMLDAKLNGGISPGVLRLIGFNQAGKTPESFEVMRNFFKAQPEKGLGIYIKAEGRLSEETKERAGIPFIFGKPEGKWVAGTCYVHECNIFENILEMIEELVKNNPENHRYCIIIDSLDAVILRQDLLKNINEAVKVAGPQVMMKLFFKQCAQYIAKMGHIFIMISQVSANVSIDSRNQAPIRQVSGTGGNAALHWADVMLDYSPQFGKDLILDDG